MRSRLAPPLAAITERLWSAGFVLASHVAPRPACRWRSAGTERVLLVAPHPDDEMAGAAGTLALHRRAGDEVTLLVVSDGRRSRALALSPEATARVRMAEAREAARRLDLRLVLLGLPEGEWVGEALEPLLYEWLARLTPDLLYLPSRIDYHPEHRRVAGVLARLVAPDARLRCYQVYVPLTAQLTTLVTPIDAVLPQVRATRAAYASQADGLARSLRLRRYTARRHALPGHAEAFLELDGATYRALHRGDPDRWPVLRGLRGRPWSDPLAYLAGRRARADAARLVGRGG